MRPAPIRCVDFTTQLFEEGATPESDVVGVGGPMDDGAVAVLVRAEVIRMWAAQKSGHEGQDPIEDDGTRSDGSRSEAGGDGASKAIKLEMVAHHEKGEISDRVGDLLDRELDSAREGIRLNCELESVLDGTSGSRTAIDHVEADVGADLAKVCPPPVCGSAALCVALISPQPVCDFAPMNGSAVLVEMHDRTSKSNEIPVAPMVLGTQSTVDSVGGIAEELEPSCEFIQNAAKRCMIPVCGIANVGSAVAPGGKLHGVAYPRTILGGPAAVCAPVEEFKIDCSSSLDAKGAGESSEAVPVGPLIGKGAASVEQCVDLDAGIGLVGHGVESAVSLPMGGSPCAVLKQTFQDQGCSEVVSSIAEVVMDPVADPVESLAKDYLPPAPGVGLQEWVRVAKDNRNGKKKRGSKSAVAMGKIGAQAAVAVAAPPPDDPFPPFSRVPSGPAGACDVRVPVSNSGLDSNIGGGVDAVPSHDVGKKFSWKELVRSTKPANVDVDLHFVEPTQIDGEPCAVFSVEEEVENMREWQHTLLCYVVGKSPSYFQFLKVVQRLWKAPGGIEVFLRENGLFYCRFSCEEDMRRVIKNGPWYMEGKLIVVKKFEGATNCEEDMLSSIPIWVKLPCLPVKWWSISGVSKVVSPIGYPLYFDVPSASQSRISYARCCVEVAMEKPLPEFVTCIGGDKVRRRQKIVYDWVPKKCSECMEFGHLVVDCYKTKNHVVPKTQMVGNKGKAKVGGQLADEPIGNGQNPVIENVIVKASRASSSNPSNSLKNIVVGGPIQARGKHSYFISDEEPISGDNQSVESLHHVSDDIGDPENEGVEEDLSSDSSSGDKEVGGVVVGLSIQPCGSEDLETKEGKEIESGNEDVTEPIAGPTHGGLDCLEDNMNGNKVKRIRKKPAPTRPEGSRITRHSGSMPIT